MIPSRSTIIKILFLAANPVDSARLQLDEEIHAIDEALRKTNLRDQFQIEKHFAVRSENLQSLLQRYQPDIVHFAGHGSEYGEILLQAEDGQTHPVSVNFLSDLFRILKDNIRCVVLNACYTEWQVKAIAEHIDVVVGMDRAIEDKTARSFAAGFYEGLGYGRSVQESFELGKLRVGLIKPNEKEIPQLLTKHVNPEEIVFASPISLADREAPAPGEPPYKGLHFYDVTDADHFFGREQWIAALVGYLRAGHRFLAVIGASGSGKSSLVRAGLVPALQKFEPLVDGTFPPKNSDRWLWRIIEPTAHPLETLAKALVPSDHPENVIKLIERMKVEPRSLNIYARQFVQNCKSEHLLLVIDQFEEMFTRCKDREQQQEFVSNLLMAAVEDDVTTVVITLRADFYHRCAEFDDLRLAVERNQRYIGPIIKDELRAVIDKSAKFGNWELEQGLVELLLDDAAAEPGALPLLSHALLETWKRRRGRTLTFVGYFESGRVHGAIAQTAEHVLTKQLTPEEQVIAKNIFMQLTELGEGVQDTRRRVPLIDLIPSTGQTAKVENVLQVLENARLVTASHETGLKENERNVYVDVAHEALIREWQTLRNWLKDNREGLRVRRHLLETAKEWKRRKRDSSELYRGLRLEQASAWGEEHANELTEPEKLFLDASRAEHRETQQRDLTQTRRARNLAWTAFGAAIVALVLSVVVGWQLYDQNRKLQIESLLSEAKELKMILQPKAAIEKLKEAVEAAKKISVNLDVNVSVEISDTMSYVATNWVQQGEQLAAKGDYAGASVKLYEALALNPPSNLPVYVWIDAGEFTMGAHEDDKESNDDEKPQHTLYLNGYWIMRTEVTNEQYMRCVRAGSCEKPKNARWDKPQFANWPANGVDWDQANAYTQWVGRRLPTESEWEKACRSADGRIYPWGNDAPSQERLNYQKSEIYEENSVGSYPAGANGLYDMAGNVYEWTSSRYLSYPYNPKDGREESDLNASWVYRGGSFGSSDANVRCAFRNKTTPGIRDNSVGFRVVLPGQ